MHLYIAEAQLLRRAREHTESVRTQVELLGDDTAEQLDRAAGALEAMYDAELALWSDPDRRLDADELAVVTCELAATWISLAMIRFLRLAAELGARVAERWPDKTAAWHEHGYEIAATIGNSSGDYDAASDYLRHHTDELLGNPGEQP